MEKMQLSYKKQDGTINFYLEAPFPDGMSKEENEEIVKLTLPIVVKFVDTLVAAVRLAKYTTAGLLYLPDYLDWVYKMIISWWEDDDQHKTLQ